MPETLSLVDHDSDWGRHVPAWWRGRMLAWAHAVPPDWPGADKLIQVLRNPIKHGGQDCYDVTVWGYRLRLTDKGNRSERRLLFAPQRFDPDERAFLASHVGPGAVFVDVGANVGAFTYWASRCMRDEGRIIAFEPDHEMRARLAFNVRTNDMAHVAIESVALSDHAGSAVLYIDPRQRGRNTLEAEAARADGTERQTITVPLETLWARLQALGVERVDALKIDIEGHEVPVLRHFFEHAPRTAWPKALLTESAHDAHDALHDLVVGAGYDCVLRTDLNRGYTLQPRTR